MGSEGSSPRSQNSAIDPVLSQLEPDHIFIPCFCKMHFDIFLPYTTCLPSQFCSFGFLQSKVRKDLFPTSWRFLYDKQPLGLYHCLTLCLHINSTRTSFFVDRNILFFFSPVQDVSFLASHCVQVIHRL